MVSRQIYIITDTGINNNFFQELRIYILQQTWWMKKAIAGIKLDTKQKMKLE